jgi:CBS domain containing-hemolysin-like protein
MDGEKTQVLLALRATAQESLKEMRTRVFSIVSTAITLFTVFIGWIVQKQSKPSLQETLLFVCIILVFWIGNLLSSQSKLITKH